METLAASYKKDKKLHHAYLLSGEREKEIEGILSFLKRERRVATEGNPDVTVVRLDTFGIDDARAMKEMASRKSFKDGKFFIVAAHFLTREAQNSLLKLFEDPASDTYFFLLTEHPETLLPTLLSRLSRVGGAEGGRDTELERAALHFLSLAPAARLEEEKVKALIEEKDKESTSRFIDALTEKLHSHFGKDYGRAEEVFAVLLMGKRFIKDRSASVKLILEHLSLTLPVLSAE